MTGDDGFVQPVDPDELGQGEEALLGLVFFFSVSKARASAEAVVGIGAGVTVEFFEEKAFLLDRKGLVAMDPDLKVVRRCFDDHASWFEGAIGKEMMCPKHGIRDVIGQEIAGRVVGLDEDMPAIGVFRFEVRDAGWIGLNDPAAFVEVENSQFPVGEKITVEFFKDGYHGFL